MKPDEKGEVSLAQKVIRTYTYVAIWIGLSATVILVSNVDCPTTAAVGGHISNRCLQLSCIHSQPHSAETAPAISTGSLPEGTALVHRAACTVPRRAATTFCQPVAQQ